MSKAKCELKKRKLDHIHSEKLDLDQKKDAQHPYYYVVPGTVAGSLYLSTYLVFITTLWCTNNYIHFLCQETKEQKLSHLPNIQWVNEGLELGVVLNSNCLSELTLEM